MDLVNKTFEECKSDKAGDIYADWIDGEFRCLIMRGPCSLCAYIGVPNGHPFYGKDCSDLDIDCHGGLTFSAEAHGKWPEGYWWFGWDYGHYGDAVFYDKFYNYDELQWEPEWVYNEFPEVIAQFRNQSPATACQP